MARSIWYRTRREPSWAKKRVGPDRAQAYTPDGSLATERRNLLRRAIENIGRTLLLVDFGEAGKEYVLDHEVETQRKN